MVSYRYKMTGLKELRRNPPYHRVFTVFPEARSPAPVVGMVGWPAQHRSFDSSSSFILEVQRPCDRNQRLRCCHQTCCTCCLKARDEQHSSVDRERSILRGKSFATSFPPWLDLHSLPDKLLLLLLVGIERTSLYNCVFLQSVGAASVPAVPDFLSG